MSQSMCTVSATSGRVGWYRSLPIAICTLALLPTLTACFLRDELDPALELPKSYQAAHGSPDAATPPLDWWRSFRSGELTDLMQQAQAANFDIAAAIARIVQADAQTRIAGAPLLPSIDATVSAQRSQTSAAATGGLGSVTSLYTPALNPSFTLDFWGRNQALLRAAEHSAVASRFARDVVALTTSASIANTYFLVLEGQDRIGIAQKNLASAEGALKIIRDRFDQGTAGALDVAQQASLAAIQRSSIPPLIEQVQQNTAALALLVGRAPPGFSVKGGSMYRLSIPRVTPGLPSELLQQRPDVRQAEANLAAANANVEAARAAFFPNIQLTGQAGLQSLTLKTLFGPGAAIYTITAALTQPIFDGGTLLGQLDQQKGSREELLQDYRKSVISGFTDVEKALVAIEQTNRQELFQREAVKESQRAFDISQDKLRRGTIDLTTLLTIEQTLFTQQDTLAQVRFARLEAAIALYQALGGGWIKDEMYKAEGWAAKDPLRYGE
jgi:outer membrane protein, multidrug efflux system